MIPFCFSSGQNVTAFVLKRDRGAICFSVAIVAVQALMKAANYSDVK